MNNEWLGLINFKIGDTYDSRDHSIEENITVLGEAMAKAIAKAKTVGISPGTRFIVTDVNPEEKTITIGERK